MTEIFTWIAVFLAIALTIWAIVRENDRRGRRTVEEWERDYAAGQGKASQFMRAGAMGLEAIFVAEKRAAIEFKQDELKGMTKTGTKGDDEDRTAVATDGSD